jgi:hypothetical protein
MEPEEEQEQNKKNGIKREFFKDNFDSPWKVMSSIAATLCGKYYSIY